MNHCLSNSRHINDTFGECGRPRVGWQIDPFGHSREFASLLAQMGYDGLFLGRIDYQDKVNRLTKKNAEFLWHASDSLDPKKSDLFTGAMYNTYSPPPGFCFDILCQDEPIIDDKKSKDYNVERRVSLILILKLFTFIVIFCAGMRREGQRFLTNFFLLCFFCVFHCVIFSVLSLVIS